MQPDALEESLKELAYKRLSVRSGKLIATEAIHFVASKTKLTVGAHCLCVEFWTGEHGSHADCLAVSLVRNHEIILGQRTLLGVVLLAIDLDYRSDPPRKEQKKIHSLNQEGSITAALFTSSRVVVYVDLR